MRNGRKNTIRIGTFSSDKKGVMSGKIYGLGLGVTPVMFEPQTSKDGKGYFRLIADPAKEAYEIGAAFPREANGLNYHSVSLDSTPIAEMRRLKGSQIPVTGLAFLDDRLPN